MAQEIAPEERSILVLFEESDTENVSTRDIRERTALEENQIHYRIDTLEEKGYIEKSYDNEATSVGESPMKVLSLTDAGWEAIQKGATVGETLDDATFDAEEKYHELEERLGLAQGLGSRVGDVEDDVGSLRDAVNSEVVAGLRAQFHVLAELKAEVEDTTVEAARAEITERHETFKDE